MKLLVTGSEGSLMQAVIPLLLKQGHTVRGADNFARYGELQRTRDYEFLRGDLTDPAFADKAVSGMDGVIQAAALIYGVGGFHRRPADILSCDVKLHCNVLDAMRRQSVTKVAYISSSMVYERCYEHPSREEDAFESLLPSTDYGLSKVTGERLVLAYAAQYGMRYTIWRPFNIITPLEKGEKELGTSHVFADYIRNIVIEKKNPLPIIGDGKQVRCFTWIHDVARGIAMNAFDNPDAENDTFNLGNPEPVTMRELAELIYVRAQVAGVLEKTDKALAFETVACYDDDVTLRIPDVAKAHQVLGWEAKLSVCESVDACLKEYAPK